MDVWRPWSLRSPTAHDRPAPGGDGAGTYTHFQTHFHLYRCPLSQAQVSLSNFPSTHVLQALSACWARSLWQPPFWLGAPPQDQMQMLGERLYHLIQGIQPSLVVRVTVMLLELDNTEILQLLPRTIRPNRKVLHTSTPRNGELQNLEHKIRQKDRHAWCEIPHQQVSHQTAGSAD